jgi:hypothetical protein
MDCANGARIYLVPTLDPRLCAVFLDPRNSLSKLQSGGSDEQPDKLTGFKNFVQSCFTHTTHVEEEMQDKDLWVPNFRVTHISDDSLCQTFSGDPKTPSPLPNSVSCF